MQSIWEKGIEMRERSTLKRDIKTQIAVVGAGLSGILVGHFFKEAGFQVVILEGNRVGSGVTKNTTGKISSGHPMFYNKSIQDFGLEKTIRYANYQTQAIKQFKEIIEKNKIDCDYEEKTAYVYVTKESSSLEKEYEATKKVGLITSFEKETELPFPINNAIAFHDQAQFHPLKFIEKLSEDLDIYENTMVKDIDGSKVITDQAIIEADYIIVTTHYPFLKFKGLYFPRVHQEGSRVIALNNCKEMKGMYIDGTKGGYSFRPYKNWLLIGEVGNRYSDKLFGTDYKELEKTAKSWYANAVVEARWSNQDCMTLDSFPYIGQYFMGNKKVFVVAGFQKWGMTGAMVGATVLRDMILGKLSQKDNIFTPQRLPIKASYSTFFKELKIDLKNETISKMKKAAITVEDLPPGNGGVVKYDGEKMGAFKDESGIIHLVSTTCPHLGCELIWNQEDRTWDCPCHASRFDYKGAVYNNPASKAITIKSI